MTTVLPNPFLSVIERSIMILEAEKQTEILELEDGCISLAQTCPQDGDQIVILTTRQARLVADELARLADEIDEATLLAIQENFEN